MSKPISPALRALLRREIVRQFAASVARLYTVQDVVRHLQCHESTFYRYRAAWRFPAPDINEGSFIRWHPQTVLNWKKPNDRN